MALVFTTSYVADSIDLLRHYKTMGEKALAQCPNEAFATAIDPQSNSVGTIVKHISGNMLSRWTNFLTTDGEKPTRDRDGEFEAPPTTRAETMAVWDAGWACLFGALESLTDADLARTVTIRSEPHSVMQAINRQIAHYSSHIGQIIFLCKHLGHENWQAITIPRKASQSFNADVASGRKSQR
jgi:hypothetical protein